MQPSHCYFTIESLPESEVIAFFVHTSVASVKRQSFFSSIPTGWFSFETHGPKILCQNKKENMLFFDIRIICYRWLACFHQNTSVGQEPSLSAN